MQSNSIESDLSFQEYAAQLNSIKEQEATLDIYKDALANIDTSLPKSVRKFLTSTKNNNLANGQYSSQLIELLRENLSLTKRQFCHIFSIAHLRFAVIDDLIEEEGNQTQWQSLWDCHSFSNLPPSLQQEAAEQDVKQAVKHFYSEETKIKMNKSAEKLISSITGYIDSFLVTNEEARNQNRKHDKRQVYENFLCMIDNTKMNSFKNTLEIFLMKVNFALRFKDYDALNLAIQSMNEAFVTFSKDSKEVTKAIAAYNLVYDEAYACRN
jgi:hypothetical protein